MKYPLIFLFLLMALTTYVPANDIFIDNSPLNNPAPVEVKTNYSKHRISVATSGRDDHLPCGLTRSEKTANALSRAMGRTVLHVSSCNVIYVINK